MSDPPVPSPPAEPHDAAVPLAVHDEPRADPELEETFGSASFSAETLEAPGSSTEELLHGANDGTAPLGGEELKGLLEALIFASDSPMRGADLARLAGAPLGEIKTHLAQLAAEYATRGLQLREIAGGWTFRTHPAHGPYIRALTREKPVRLTRAQLETLAILAYRQPITRPEIDEVRGVDSGPVLKVLLERHLIRVLGKKDEPGRPILYGTTSYFLEFFSLRSLRDLPTLREFTELTEDSQRIVERELGADAPAADEPAETAPAGVFAHPAQPPSEDVDHDGAEPR